MFKNIFSRQKNKTPNDINAFKEFEGKTIEAEQ
jgi:hypothetical protein